MGRKSNTPPLDQQQQSAASGERNELRQVAALRLPGRRTVRLEEQQKQRFFFRFRPVAHPPEAATRLGRRGRRFSEPPASLSVQAVEACGVWGRGWQQKTLCVPPRREASARATLRVAEARPSAAGKLATIFPPKEQAQPKALPRVRLTAAPLSLRHIPVARGNSCRIGPEPTGRICHLRRAGDGFHAPFFDRARSSFDPLKTALRGRRPGDPGGTERYYVSLNLFGPVLGARLRDSSIFG